MPSLVNRPSWILAAAVCLVPGTTSGAGRGDDDTPWTSLFDGQSLAGWREGAGEWLAAGEVPLNPEDNTRFLIVPGEGILVNGDEGKEHNLLTVAEHGDVELHLEFAVTKGSNSGVYFQGRYEIQILDSWGVEHPKYSDCGGIYQRWKDGQGYDGHAPSENASLAPGEWQSFDVVFRAARFEKGEKVQNARFVKVVHNGKTIHGDVELTGPTRASTYEDEAATGPLMLQGDHGPVAFRELRMRPLAEP
jgi:hypothetical protein